MLLGHALEFVAEAPGLETFDNFRSHIDSSWIQAALESTGTASMRRRRLPAEQVIWLVLGIALYRDRSIAHVADSLDLIWLCPAQAGPPRHPVRSLKHEPGSAMSPWSGYSEHVLTIGRTRAPIDTAGGDSPSTGSTARRFVSPTRMKTASTSGSPAEARGVWPRTLNCGSFAWQL